jgi:hypothetical protein
MIAASILSYRFLSPSRNKSGGERGEEGGGREGEIGRNYRPVSLIHNGYVSNHELLSS